MAGDVIIAKGNIWSCGSHGYWPIIDRLRPLFDAPGATFDPLDEGFEVISVEALPAGSFQRFIQACEATRTAIATESAYAVSWRDTLRDCCDGLLSQLKVDPRAVAANDAP